MPWSSAAGGTLLLAVGLVMLLAVRGPVEVVVLLAAVGLLLAGLVRIVGVHEPAPWRACWLDVALGVGMLVGAGVAALWHAAPLRALAWVLAAILVANGLASIARGLAARGSQARAPEAQGSRARDPEARGPEARGPEARDPEARDPELRDPQARLGGARGERGTAVLSGLTSLVVGVLVLVWPRLSLAVFALVVGFWLALTGLTLVLAGPRRPRTTSRLVPSALALVLALALAAGTVALHRLDPRAEPDAFYTPPLAVPSEPGRLVRAEALPAARVPEGLRGWRILYTSTDGAGRPTVVSGTVLAPPLGTPPATGSSDVGPLPDAGRPSDPAPPGGSPPPQGPGSPSSTASPSDVGPPAGFETPRADEALAGEGPAPEGPSTSRGTVDVTDATAGRGLGPEGAAANGFPVVSVAHGTTGVVPRCAPSLAPDPFADGASAALARLVAEGWVGVTSDYVGLGTRGPHGYLVGPDAAHDVLDATRAAGELEGLALSDRTVVWGHSQGGHAALWTGIEAPSYAPELEVLGVAAFAPAADLVPLARGVRSTVGGKLVSAYIAASWAEYYDLDLDGLVTPGYVGVVRRIEGHCFDGANVLGAFAIASQLTEEVFRPEVWDGEVVELLRANTPEGDVATPVLIAQGTADRLVLADQQRDFVARRCAAGQAIDFREYAGLDHVPLVEAGSPLTDELLAWTQDRLAGQPPTPTC